MCAHRRRNNPVPQALGTGAGGESLDPRRRRYITTIFTLEPGDLILTGTPEGVGPVGPGDVVTAGITGVTEIRFEAARPV